MIFRSKKWSIPLFIAGSPFVVYSAVAYYFIGRFNPEHGYGKTEREAWEGYKGRFPAILARAVKDRVFAREQDVEEFFGLAAREGRTVLDAAGEPVLELEGARAGLTRETLMQPDSDPMVAERLMLARVDATLKAAPKDRESLGGIPGGLANSAGTRTGARGRRNAGG